MTPPKSTDLIAASKRFDRKEAAARIIRDAGLPLNMNVVLHRLNLARLDAIIDVCVRWGAERLELANAQYYGWALRNRELLMPSKIQLDEAVGVYERRKAELAGAAGAALDPPGLLRALPEAVHGRLGADGTDRRPGRRRLPLPGRRRDHDDGVRFGARPRPRVDLDEVRRVRGVPRHGLDARPVPQLPAQGTGLRRLPVPGLRVDRRCGTHRPGVPALAGPPPGAGRRWSGPTRRPGTGSSCYRRPTVSARER